MMSTSVLVSSVIIVRKVDHMSPEPLYKQLATVLREAIAAGELAPGQLVPSESSVIGDQGVSRGTVRRALELLRDEGLVITLAGRGTYVTKR